MIGILLTKVNKREVAEALQWSMDYIRYSPSFPDGSRFISPRVVIIDSIRERYPAEAIGFIRCWCVGELLDI